MRPRLAGLAATRRFPPELITLPTQGLPWAAFFVSGGNLAGFVGLLSGDAHDGALGKRCGDKHLRAKPGCGDEPAGDVIPRFCGVSRFVMSPTPRYIGLDSSNETST